MAIYAPDLNSCCEKYVTVKGKMHCVGTVKRLPVSCALITVLNGTAIRVTKDLNVL